MRSKIDRWLEASAARSAVPIAPGRYMQCAARPPTSSEAIFRRDLARTFPSDPLFAAPLTAATRSGQHALRDVLHAFVSHLESERPPEANVTYVQGMNFVAGHLIRSGATCEEAFWLLVRLWSATPLQRTSASSPHQVGGQHSGEADTAAGDARAIVCADIAAPYGLRALYAEGLPKLVGTMYTVERLLERVSPSLHALFEARGVRACVFIPQWVLPLFSHRLPPRALTRVWDEFFRDGWIAVLRTALALLRICAPILLAEGGLSFEHCTLYLTATMWDDVAALEAKGELRRAIDVACAAVDDCVELNADELRMFDAAAQIEAAATAAGRRLGSRVLPSLVELRAAMGPFIAAQSAEKWEGNGSGEGPGRGVARDAEHLEVLLSQLEIASASRRNHRRAEYRRPEPPAGDELCRGDIMPCAIA